jgi:hypothetical protein
MSSPNATEPNRMNAGMGLPVQPHPFLYDVHSGSTLAGYGTTNRWRPRESSGGYDARDPYADGD